MKKLLAIKLSLATSEFIEAGETIKAIDNGCQMLLDDSEIDVNESGILSTYKIRLEHISKKKGKHAKRLTLSTAEFVTKLETSKPNKLKTANVILPNNNEECGKYLIWYQPKTFAIIGCCYLISHSSVPKTTWNEMWNGI